MRRFTSVQNNVSVYRYFIGQKVLVGSSICSGGLRCNRCRFSTCTTDTVRFDSHLEKGETFIMVIVSKNTEHIHHGRPPWHAVLVLGTLVFLSILFFPTPSDLDHTVAVPETFTKRLFPKYMSVQALVIVRSISAAFILGLSLYALLLAMFGSEPTVLVIPYLAQSKLQRGKPIALKGLYSQAAFTMWAWNLLGVSFGVNAYVTYLIMHERPVSPWLLRTAILLFEMAAPFTLLVAAVVKYALWPQSLKNGAGKDPTKSFKVFRVLCFHNLNVVLAMSEVALWGGLPVRFHDASLAILFGCAFVAFAWAIRNGWNPSAGPQFLYFFLDTTLGITTSLVLIALCLVFVMFYAFFCVLHVGLDHMESAGLLAHVFSVVIVCALVCRVRD